MELVLVYCSPGFQGLGHDPSSKGCTEDTLGSRNIPYCFLMILVSNGLFRCQEFPSAAPHDAIEYLFALFVRHTSRGIRSVTSSLSRGIMSSDKMESSPCHLIILDRILGHKIRFIVG